MKTVDIRNHEVLSLLEQAVSLWRDDPLFRESVVFTGETDNREDFISDEYFRQIVYKGKQHDGYPEKSHMASLRRESFASRKADPTYTNRYIKGFEKINTSLTQTLGTRRNALAAVYPPGGFIGWHNNANASAYNLIMTWSETGDGYWKHWNPIARRMETIPDKPGWQAKATFFGSYDDDPDDIVYHMASTDCWRMTIAYVFDRKHKQFWEDALEELGYE